MGECSDEHHRERARPDRVDREDQDRQPQGDDASSCSHAGLGLADRDAGAG